MSWSVTIPDDATQGSYAVAAVVSYQQGQSTQTTGGTYSLNVIPKGLVYIDLPFVSSTNGFGPVERDENVADPVRMTAARSASTASATPRAWAPTRSQAS